MLCSKEIYGFADIVLFILCFSATLKPTPRSKAILLMFPAPQPENEERLQKLYELDILDTLEEQAYDDLTLLAAQICEIPIALISLIDRDRQFLKSHHVYEVSRELHESF